jgi:hypothetical protein
MALAIDRDGDVDHLSVRSDQSLHQRGVWRPHHRQGTGDSMDPGEREWLQRRGGGKALWDPKDVLPEGDEVWGEEGVEQQRVEEVLREHPARGDQVPVIPQRGLSDRRPTAVVQRARGELERLLAMGEEVGDVGDVVQMSNEERNLWRVSTVSLSIEDQVIVPAGSEINVLTGASV